jgi:hypothetical protein
LSEKTFYAMLAAAAVFIAIGIAAIIHSGVAIEVPLDNTLPPGQVDEITPRMGEGNRLAIQVSGSTFDFTVQDPDRNILVSATDESDVSYEFTADTPGEYKVIIHNTGDSDVIITGTTETMAGQLRFAGPMMLIITGVIVAGLGLRFRRH